MLSVTLILLEVSQYDSVISSLLVDSQGRSLGQVRRNRLLVPLALSALDHLRASLAYRAVRTIQPLKQA